MYVYDSSRLDNTTLTVLIAGLGANMNVQSQLVGELGCRDQNKIANAMEVIPNVGPGLKVWAVRKLNG